MFGRRDKDLTKVIKEGDLESLKEILEKDQDVIIKKLKWEGGHGGNILHAAAFFNQPALVEFLVAEQGMDKNKLSSSDWTPLHHAAATDLSLAVKALLKLGADTSLKSHGRWKPYDLCKDKETKELLSSAEQEQQREKENQRAEEAYKEAAAKTQDTWTSPSPDKIKHRYKEQGDPYLVTETFNLAAKRLTVIAENILTGDLSSPKVEILNKDNAAMFEQARVQLQKIHGITLPEVAPPAEAVPPAAARKPVLRSNDHLRDF